MHGPLRPDMSHSTVSRLNQPDGGADTPDMDRHPPRSATNPLRWVAVSILAFSLAGCVIFGEPPEPPPCNCPQFERLAASMDWGPATEPELASTGSEDGSWLGVELWYPIDNLSADLDSIAGRLDAAGIDHERHELTNSVTIDQSKTLLFVAVQPATDPTSPTSLLYVKLSIRGTDDEAAAILAPLVNALGGR